MRTLDEVIKANECCKRDNRCEGCPYNGIGSCGLERETDTLHYLKEYRDDRENFSEAISNCGKALNEYIMDIHALAQQEENLPLTWDELRQMCGKPVLVVADGKERWRIIREVSNELLILESGLPLHKSWMDKPDGWKAYRKEPKELHIYRKEQNESIK